MPDPRWRQDPRQGQNLYIGCDYVGLMFSPQTAARVAAAMNQDDVVDDDVVDAEFIDWPEQVAALEAQRAAVLAIHHPCHTTTRECERTHELTTPPECVGCGYQSSCELPVDYPCETAQALGVRS